MGNSAPQKLPPKRDWTYRQVLWQAKTLGHTLQMPAMHPFNPLGLLRLAVACGDSAGYTNRFVTQQVFHHVWQGGTSASDESRLAQLTERLADKIQTGYEPTSEAVKARLKANTDEALQAGCFGVPSLVVADGKVFWGLDALPMLREYLQGDAWFNAPEGWDSVAQVGVGVKRQA